MARNKSVALVGIALAMLAGIAQADNPVPSHQRVLPVLVKLNTQGRVTDVNPALRLPPKIDRLLRANINELFSGPTNTAAPGDSDSSRQFVANMTTVATPSGSEYLQTVHFALVSTQTVPIGNWYWAHTDGRRLALVNRNLPPVSRMQREPSDRSQNGSSPPNNGGPSGGNGGTPPATRGKST
ncbi:MULTISPECIES: hypothetical protein [Stenotrophomonas]|uniref:hypothetical protein n=1 Tax=Stenotrophomonas TaxID=40323 RepID=UPI000A9B76A7|nr:MULTISPECIES: hypothetical protein [Stenotrophomonas]